MQTDKAGRQRSAKVSALRQPRHHDTGGAKGIKRVTRLISVEFERMHTVFGLLLCEVLDP